MDFSTLEKRKAACEAELDVNRRFAPSLYRGILPVTQESDGKLALAGKGTPVEWAVEMYRFDENRTLDRIAEQHGLDTELANKLGETVAAAHATSPPAQVDA